MANHPANKHYDLNQAEKYLEFATQFTPQYGDSFLEMMRLNFLLGQPDKNAALKRICIHCEPNYGVLWFYFKDSII